MTAAETPDRSDTTPEQTPSSSGAGSGAPRSGSAPSGSAAKGAEAPGAAKKAAPKKAAPKKAAPKKAAAKQAAAKTSAARTSAKPATRGAAGAAARPSASTHGGAFAAGAARASGERRRRSGTPLLSIEPVEVSEARRRAASDDSEPVAPTPEPDVLPVVSQTPDDQAVFEQVTLGAPPVEAESSGASEAPVAEAPNTTRPARPSRAAIRAKRRDVGHGEPTRLRAVPSGDAAERPAKVTAEGEPARRHTGSGEGVETGSAAAERLLGALEAGEFSSEARPGPAELVELAINVIRAAATSAGVPAEDVERQVAETLAYLRRRLSGDYVVDEFGFDEDYTIHVHLPLLRPLYRRWFRVEVRGIENIPTVGGALVVGNHSGTVAMDSLMTQVAVYDEHPANRHLRMLGADLVFQMPFVGTMARRSGSTLAANTDAERLLRGGELVGVWPEGFKGVGKPFSERYKLQRFGRGGFVSAALRAGVPIVPVSIVGAEEIYPMIGNMPAVARLLGVPYAPITPTFPWLGPLGLVPLPSKWLIEFGPPIDTTMFGPDAADDPMLVFDLTDQVRETIQQTLYSLLMQRKSVFL
ncbi:1-acyl-sn-glycerol-3-phosphate acyltransferase [Monashia sp. NPDC004114]